MDRSRRASEDDPRPGDRPGGGDPAVAAALRSFGDAIARQERDRALARLEEPTPRQRAAIDELASALAGRVLANPVSSLESDDCPADVASDVRELFDPDPRSIEPTDRDE